MWFPCWRWPRCTRSPPPVRSCGRTDCRTRQTKVSELLSGEVRWEWHFGVNSPVKVWADLVRTACLEGMALRAARLEERSTLASVTCRKKEKKHQHQKPSPTESGWRASRRTRHVYNLTVRTENKFVKGEEDGALCAVESVGRRGGGKEKRWSMTTKDGWCGGRNFALGPTFMTSRSSGSFRLDYVIYSFTKLSPSQSESMYFAPSFSVFESSSLRRGHHRNVGKVAREW